MLFTTITFWALFIAFLVPLAFLRKYTRKGMMLYVIAASLLFFYQANGYLMVLLPLVAICSWRYSFRMRSSRGIKRKAWITFIIIWDLIPLLYLKYTNFAIEVFNEILHTNFAPQSIALPIGISFFTFQAISHAVDVYRGKFKMRVTLLEYFFYLTFFPLLLAGPITRAANFFPQARQNKPLSKHLAYMGVWLIILGLIKKSVISDYLSQYNNWIFDDPMGFSGFENLMGALGYYMQIYCDFSGYSDLSIGMAAIIGIRLPDNFYFPYQATNIGEFWHRWHISLSTWFRDYLYIPLGGNRKGKIMTYVNNFITMAVAGLWHGATWMFIIWGCFHGIGLIIQKALSPITKHIPNNIPINVVCWLMTTIFVASAWVFFRAENMDSALNIFKQITTNFDIAYLMPFIKARPTWTAMFIIAFVISQVRTRWYERMQLCFIKSPWIVKLALFLCAVQLVIEFHTSSVRPFIYYRF